MTTEQEQLLEVTDLKTHFFLEEGTVRAVDGVSFDISRREVVGVVGESGCGKSVLARSIMGIVQPPGETIEGNLRYYQKDEEGIDLLSLGRNSKEMRNIRGGQIAMVFQEPMVSFSPVHSIGDQITEAILLHNNVSKEEARNQVIDLLTKVGIPNASQRIDEYSFRLSGGMRQRAMIALALACNPGLLIADEPTTALDVTTQAQILELMKSLQEEFGMGMILITHNLGVVAQMAHKIVVMYLGKIVEMADTRELFDDPKHPYTQELLRSIPKLSRERSTERLNAISGNVPPPFARPSGCTFHPRCPQAMKGKCDVIEPSQTNLSDGRVVSCLLYEEDEN